MFAALGRFFLKRVEATKLEAQTALIAPRRQVLKAAASISQFVGRTFPR